MLGGVKIKPVYSKLSVENNENDNLSKGLSSVENIIRNWTTTFRSNS